MSVIDGLVSVALVVFGAAGLKLVSDSALWNELFHQRSPRSGFGTVQREAGAVRYRPNGSPFWFDLAGERQQMGDGDSIFTGGDGTARLELGDGDSAHVLADTLVVVEAPRRSGGLDARWLADSLGSVARRGTLRLEAGSLRLLLGGPRHSRKIASGEKVLEVSSAEKSSVEIFRDAKNKSEPLLFLKASSPLEIDGMRWSAPDFKIVAVHPSDRELLVVAGDGAPLDFEWRDSAAASSDALLVVEGDSSLSVPLTGALAGAHAAKLQLAPGRYRWRLASGHAPLSQWSSFRLIALVPPRVLGPADGAQLEAASGGPAEAVHFTWKALDAGLESELELENGGGAAAGLVAGAKLEVAVGKEYRWRVRSRTDPAFGLKPEQSEWTEWRRFALLAAGAAVGARPAGVVPQTPVPSASPSPVPAQVAVRAPVAVPAPVPRPAPSKSPPAKPVAARSSGPSLGSPADGTEFDSGSTALLTWSKLASAREYGVQVSTVPGFGSTVLNSRRVENNVAFHPARPGLYYWRVRGIRGDEEGEWSEVRSLRVR